MVQFASYLRRVLCKTHLIFPRINGPNKKLSTFGEKSTANFATLLLLCFPGKLASQNSMQRKVGVIKWPTDLAVKKKGQGEKESEINTIIGLQETNFG